MVKRVHRGYGWSQQGTKASLRQRRLRMRSSKYYAVAVGRRTGIYDCWDDAYKQVQRYSGATHKSFKTLEEAFICMYHNRLSPPGTRTIYPWMQDTPHPPEVYQEAYLAYWREQEGLQLG